MKGAWIVVVLLAGTACGRAALVEGEPEETSASSGNAAGPTTGQGASSGVGPGSASGGSTVGSAAGGSSGSMSSTGTGTMICPPFNDACTGCASVNCPEIWCGCVNNMDCIGLFQCFAACMEDPDCEDGCMATHQNGISAALLVGGCAGTTCSGVCDWGNPNFDPCQECIYTDCSAEMNACLALPACGLLYQCLTGCGPLGLSCQQQCYRDYPGGVQLLETALLCIADQCQMECN